MLKKILSIIYIFIFSSIMCFANVYDFIETKYNHVFKLEQNLYKESPKVQNLHKLLDEIRNDGTKDSIDLIPEIIHCIKGLNERDADLDTLERLYNTAIELDSFLKIYGNTKDISNIQQISTLNRSLKRTVKIGREDHTDSIFKKYNLENISGKIHEEILKLETDFDVKLLSLDVANGVNLSAKYKWGIEPSYKDNYFTRIDSYKLGTDIKVGDMLKGFTGKVLPLFLDLDANSEIFFLQDTSKVR